MGVHAKVKVVLIDDEHLALQYLEKVLKSYEGIEIVKTYMDPLQAIGDIRDTKPDIVFLDVELPEMNGIEIAEQILLHHSDTHIVFVTAYEYYAVKAFELNALDYVLKPVRRERLENTLKRIEKEKAEMAPDGSPQSICQIRCFQSIQWESPEGGAETIRWRTSKAQELFAYLSTDGGNPFERMFFWRCSGRRPNGKKGTPTSIRRCIRSARHWTGWGSG